MPVMAVNMILTGSYLPALFGIQLSGFWGKTITLFDASLPVTYFTLIVGAILSGLLLLISNRGIRFGTAAATVLGLLSMIPLTIIAVAPFLTGDVHGSNLWPANLPDGTAFFSGAAFYLFLQFSALYTWNAIAMEAAACYIGEVKNPDRDAPLAMNLSGGYGTFIYTFLPMAVLGVLGVKFIANSLDPNTILVLSNVGYVGSFVPVLLGYYFLRKWRPEIHRPFKLPEWMKYAAIALAALYFVVWAVGIPACAIEGCQLGGGKMFLIGVLVVLLYFPLNWWRRTEDQRLGTTDYRATTTSV
jgi:amino acid transporter